MRGRGFNSTDSALPPIMRSLHRLRGVGGQGPGADRQLGPDVAEARRTRPSLFINAAPRMDRPVPMQSARRVTSSPSCWTHTGFRCGGAGCAVRGMTDAGIGGVVGTDVAGTATAAAHRLCTTEALVALALVHCLYQDEAWATELVAPNDSPHPLPMPASEGTGDTRRDTTNRQSDSTVIELINLMNKK